MKDKLMTQEQMEALYNVHVKRGTARGFDEWIKQWAPNELRIRVTVTTGRDGPDCCLTYGTMKEHRENFEDWSEGMSDQGYRCNDITDMRPSTLDAITYQPTGKGFETKRQAACPDEPHTS